MTTYNKRSARTQVHSPVKTSSVPTGTTHEGHPGYVRDSKSELFLLASTQFMRQNTFYENAQKRDNRLVSLVHRVTQEDPVWVLNLARWLRREANLRSVALVVGLEGAKAVLEHTPGIHFMGEVPETGGQGIVRLLAKAGILRADEPGEALAYWYSKYGRNIPIPVKNAIADKAKELYNERALLKYDTDSHAFRFADVIELAHPSPGAPWQSDLFKYAIDRRHNRDNGIPSILEMIVQNSMLRSIAVSGEGLDVLLDPNRIRAAGMNWEDVLSLVGDKLPKQSLWKAMIPSMGYMALLRNLRNFDQANIPDHLATIIANKLSNPQEVAKSRQLPMRFLSAYQNAPSLRWAWPLEQALNLSLGNVPELPGRTLILVDTSGSMNNAFSSRADLRRWDVASLFGIVLAKRCHDQHLVSFSDRTMLFPLIEGSGSVLPAWKRWQRNGYNIGHGTYTANALREMYNRHDRVVVITDEQAHMTRNSEVTDSVPAHIPMHTINVAGYQMGYAPSGQDNRHVYGGLDDQVFRLIPIVESATNGVWPWESVQ